MENKINIAELLKDCPKGMELYSTIYGTVYFKEVRDTGNAVLIDVKTSCNTEVQFYPDGKFNTYYSDSEMTLFPSKDVRTWEGFVPPCKFKDGDILATNLGSVFILKEPNENVFYYSCYVALNDVSRFITSYTKFCIKNGCRLATEEEKQKLFDAITASGYKWNAETKTLEKLPKFKVGDRVRSTIVNSGNIYTVLKVEASQYVVKKNNETGNCNIYFDEENNFELVPNKFDINTLVPFDKVLVRDCNEDKWNIDFFGYYRDDGTYQCMTFTKNQCIPYEGNQHLLGTTNDCDNFYKIWEK